jgi:hypothetical protein
MFTINNPTDTVRAYLRDLHVGQDHTRYCSYQEEKAPSTGTIHFQGYIEWSDKIRPITMKVYKGWDFTRVFDPRGAIKYSKKTETRIEGGQTGEIGSAARFRNDTIEDVCDHIKSGGTIQEIIATHPTMDFMHHDKIVRKVLDTLPDRTACNINIYFGITGCGKSTYVRTRAENYYAVPTVTRHNGRWDWDSYEGQSNIVIDEFDDTWVTATDFKRFFDVFEYQIERKGSNMPMKSNHIWITTNKDPGFWYSKMTDEARRPLLRRLKEFANIFDCRKNPAYTLGGKEPFMLMAARNNFQWKRNPFPIFQK